MLLKWSVVRGGSTSLNNWADVKTPTALTLVLAMPPYKSPYLTTTTILYFFSRISSITRPMDVVVVTQGGGLLIMADSGEFNCTKCTSHLAPDESSVWTTWLGWQISQMAELDVFFIWSSKTSLCDSMYENHMQKSDICFLWVLQVKPCFIPEKLILSLSHANYKTNSVLSSKVAQKEFC